MIELCFSDGYIHLKLAIDGSIYWIRIGTQAVLIEAIRL